MHLGLFPPPCLLTDVVLLFPAGQVHPDERLQRRGKDLHSSLELMLYDAVLGARVTVATPRGERTLTVPPGTEYSTLLVG